MQDKINRLLPKYVRLPLLLVVILNFLTYTLLPPLLVADESRIDITSPWDTTLPLIPFFLLFYVLAYVQWVGSYIFHSRDSVKVCYRIVAADLIAKLICLACFLFFPTTMVRTEVAGNGVFEWGLRFIYAIDKPINLFPSIHCLESWMCFRGALMLQKKNVWYITAQGVLTLLVFASTVLIKQHVLIDIAAGVLVCEIGLFLAGRCGLWKVFNKLQTPSAKAWLAQRDL